MRSIAVVLPRGNLVGVAPDAATLHPGDEIVLDPLQLRKEDATIQFRVAEMGRNDTQVLLPSDLTEEL
jgi:hypothetical protein